MRLVAACISRIVLYGTNARKNSEVAYRPEIYLTEYYKLKHYINS